MELLNLYWVNLVTSFIKSYYQKKKCSVNISTKFIASCLLWSILISPWKVELFYQGLKFWKFHPHHIKHIKRKPQHVSNILWLEINIFIYFYSWFLACFFVCVQVSFVLSVNLFFKFSRPIGWGINTKARWIN